MNAKTKKGFSLVEIMIAVVIIGLLAVMALPAFERARMNSMASRLANDFRVFAGAFESHALEEGVWPTDGNFNSLPASAQDYVAMGKWQTIPFAGGFWDWEYNRHGYTASVGLGNGSNLPDGVAERIDELLDDGNLNSGSFQETGGYVILILEI